MTPASIVIVEDEAIVRLSLQRKLERMGYRVTAALDTGEEAVQRAQQAPPDLMLLDIRLAGAMDGITAADLVRSRHHIPVVFLTAYSDTATLQRAKQAGPFGYIVKPYDDTDLRVAIELALHTHGLERERERLIAELQRALSDVKTLSGLLPICASCKRIRDDRGYWTQVEGYITARTAAEFSHGICPECMAKLYGDTWQGNRDP